MSAMKGISSLESAKNFEELKIVSSQQILAISSLINGNLKLGENIPGKFVEVTFATADTDTPAYHNLGYVPKGYIVIRKSAAYGVYDGLPAFTSSAIYLRSASAPMFTTVFIF